MHQQSVWTEGFTLVVQPGGMAASCWDDLIWGFPHVLSAAVRHALAGCLSRFRHSWKCPSVAQQQQMILTQPQMETTEGAGGLADMPAGWLAVPLMTLLPAAGMILYGVAPMSCQQRSDVLSLATFLSAATPRSAQQWPGNSNRPRLSHR